MPVTKILLNNVVETRHCVICRKNHTISNCEGCQLKFCERHLLKHRQELAYQLEDIMNDHELLRQDIEKTSNEYFYLRQINKWEQESIQKIRTIADNVRDEVRQTLDRTKRRFTRISRAIALDLKASYKADDFLENDLKRWIQQLNDLRVEIQSSNSLQLMQDQQSSIHNIRIVQKQLPNTINRKRKVSHSDLEERFLKATYPVSVENDGLVAKNIGTELDYGHVIGTQLYSQGCHRIRFKILHSTSPYMIFLGCISSERMPKVINYNSPFAIGWFGHNEVYQHGTWNNHVNIHGYDSTEIQSNDILCLTLDCNKRQIALYHERINKTYKLAVNVEKAPLPWQFLVVLAHPDDSIKILPRK
ncbi:hypothetical protein I4U23_019625 [Adineta vaga]|nr:hypothetical protein I4U23_019625 [Adineta vaga]